MITYADLTPDEQRRYDLQVAAVQQWGRVMGYRVMTRGEGHNAPPYPYLFESVEWFSHQNPAFLVALSDLDAGRFSPGWSPPVAREMADQIREKGQPIGDALTELIETPVPERGPWRW